MVASLERQIEAIDYPQQEPPSARRVFENKQFNVVKRDMPHLTSREIEDFIGQQWRFQLSKEERAVYEAQAAEGSARYMEAVLAANQLKCRLKQQIHDVKYAAGNPAVKPSGKLRYMSAYRFFRRDMVPVVKEQHPDFDGKARQALIRRAWKRLTDPCKFPYVQMSRADRERAIYLHKLT